MYHKVNWMFSSMLFGNVCFLFLRKMQTALNYYKIVEYEIYAVKSRVESASSKSVCIPVKVLIDLCYLGKEILKQSWL